MFISLVPRPRTSIKKELHNKSKNCRAYITARCQKSYLKQITFLQVFICYPIADIIFPFTLHLSTPSTYFLQSKLTVPLSADVSFQKTAFQNINFSPKNRIKAWAFTCQTGTCTATVQMPLPMHLPVRIHRSVLTCKCTITTASSKKDAKQRPQQQQEECQLTTHEYITTSDRCDDS